MVTRRRQWTVEAGTSFKGADGEVRHVIMTHRPGNGQGVTWDSIPLSNEYWSDEVFAARKDRPNGYMPMWKFQEWIVEQVGP